MIIKEGVAIPRRSQMDYNTVHALARRSGLNVFVVYRLMQGEHVKDPVARERFLQAWSELQPKDRQR